MKTGKWLIYHTLYDLNQGPIADHWQVDLIDLEKILKAAQKAKDEGADLTIISLHWGNEYQQKPSPYQLKIAKNFK